MEMPVAIAAMDAIFGPDRLAGFRTIGDMQPIPLNKKEAVANDGLRYRNKNVVAGGRLELPTSGL